MTPSLIYRLIRKNQKLAMRDLYNVKMYSY